jgi:excisionase family DNA binding protein
MTEQNHKTNGIKRATMPPLSPQPQNDIIMYTVKDIRNIFKCGLKQAYELVNASGFPSIRIGRKILVERSALENWLARNRGKTILK